MHSFTVLARKFAPLLASLVMIGSCCSLYDQPPAPYIQPPVTPATPACTMHFTSPKSAAVLAASGPVDFSWTLVPKASYYILSLSVPNAADNVNWNVNGTSRTLYMESFSAGNFSAHVQVRDTDANILCEAVLHFSTAAADPKKKDNPGAPPPQPPPGVTVP